MHAPASIARTSPRRLPVGALALLVLACGFTTPVVIDFVGLVYLSEVLLMPTALIALLLARGHRALHRGVFWALVLGGLLMVCGYVLSDLVRNTEQAQYLRGWAKCALQTIDVATIAIVVASDRRHLWWYACGAACGGLFFQAAIASAPIESWKITYAVPAALLVLCVVPMWAGPKLTALALTGVAGLGLALDSRADPGLALLAAMLLWARSGHARLPATMQAYARRLALPLLAGVLVLLVAFVATEQRFGIRREQSNLGRELTYTLGAEAIAQSPLIGYGSWNDNADISRRQDEIVTQELGVSRAGSFRGAGFSPHSELLQSWYEGGILAAVFFVVLVVVLLRALAEVALRRPVDPLSGLLLYALCNGLWHALMSPFAGGHRLDNALAVAAVMVVALERRARPRPVAARPREVRA